jgi:hypothetical protein
MRTTFILLFTVSFSIASDSHVRPDPGPGRLTPKAAEVVKKARQYEAATSPVVGGSSTALNAAARQGASAGATQAAWSPVSARRTRVVVRPDGSLRAYLGEEHMTDLVAVKNAGGVSTTCATDADLKALESRLRADVK